MGKPTKARFKQVARETGGDVRALASHFNVTRQTIYNWRNAWGLREYMQDCKSDMVEIAEENIYSAVLEGDLGLSQFVLTHKPRNSARWSSKQDVGISGLRLDPDVMALLPALNIDLDEASAQFNDILRAAALAVEAGR